ncbi:radial spoke head protein 9 homolog isoform X2 [Eublepharis macularius]|uniref:Radial spoke head protein 9 homolog n=1 Tax=Eublepharis macularius TaxID=481883 RepID=A0AA97L6E8_EUBMA|nr:radial spoke head protein 9 homolog isoform X2 [Eublepharis macularius]
MDAESLPYALDLVAGSGVCLSPEKRTALRTSLLLVQRDYRFEQVRLWGRIQGIRGAYYIAEGLGPDRAGARSRLYSLNCVDWSLLPPPTEEMIAMTGGIKGRFQGDPSYEYENYDKKEEGEKPYEEETGVLVKEEIRLVTTVDQIDKAVGIVPRGAYIKTPLGLVHENRTFEGSWSIQVERGGRIVVLRSLLWPGLTFYHVPNTKQHGYIYFGSGEKNIDLPFML